MSLMVSPRGGGGAGRKKKRSTGDSPTIKLTFSRYTVLKTVLKLNEDDCYIIWHKKYRNKVVSKLHVRRLDT